MNNQYTYNQPPMGQMMPPQIQMSVRQRMANGALGSQNILPKWLTQYSIGLYIIALVLISFAFSAFSMPWYYLLSGIVAVLVLFLYGSSLERELSVDKMHSVRRFEKRIFLISLIARVLFMFLLYWIFMSNYGDEFGFENADATGYDEIGKYVSDLIQKGKFDFYNEIKRYTANDDISDMGYSIYVGFVYYLTNKSILVVRLLKCVWSSLTVLLVYRLAKRNFGEKSARVAAIFCTLWPNFWYYCAVHLKETEMVFLAVLFVEQADQMLRSRKFTIWKIVPILLIAAAMFTFRTPLGLVALLALMFSAVMSSTKVVSWGKRIIVGLLAVGLIGVTIGSRLEDKATKLVEQVQGDYQKENMSWRAERKDAAGNTQSFAKYAGAAVFAPMIFTLPFPTMVRPFEGQEVQQMLNGGNYTKNILSAFTVLALVMLLISGRWREHLLPLSFMLGYLAVLALSAFAQSERFHQPAMPFEFMFAAYGLSIAVTQKKYKRWFTYWCALMFIAAVAWNWFKLAGRGLL